MEDLAQDVIITALIVVLLFGVVQLARGNIDIIQKTAMVTNKTDKIKQESLLPLSKGAVIGSDVVSVIRFYSSDSTVSIQVIEVGGATKLYQSENYDRNIFNIPYESKFNQSLFYSGNKIVQAVYTEIN